MNSKQKVVIAIGIILIITIGLYPPYNALSLSGNPTQFHGYGFLIDPPRLNPYWVAKINKNRLINQWLIVVMPTIFFFWTFKSKISND